MQTDWLAPSDVAHANIDHQVDFCEGGALAVPGGSAAVRLVNRLSTHFEVNVRTQDFHPAGHWSFASAHPGAPVFSTMQMPYGPQILWPDHCIQGTAGADFHPDLVVGPDDLVLQKGRNPHVDSYSGFFENDHASRPLFDNGDSLTERFRALNIRRLVFTGLAFDYCVGWTALDAAAEGFEALVVSDATASIAPDSAVAMTARLRQAGIELVLSCDLPSRLGVAGPSACP